jgi:hypothetical protein
MSWNELNELFLEIFGLAFFLIKERFTLSGNLPDVGVIAAGVPPS